MHWLDHGPAWLTAVLIIGFYLALAFGASRLGQRLVAPHQANNLVSDTIRSVVAFLAILMGLIAVTAWTNYREVDRAADREANAVWELYDQLESYPQPVRGELRGILRGYTRAVVEQEWPAQLADRPEAVARPELTRLRVAIAAYAGQATREPRASLYRETRARFAELAEARHARRAGRHAGLDPIMWFVVLAGTFVTVGLTALYHHPDRKLQHGLSMALAGVMGLIVFWLVALDHPLCGGVHVSADRFERLLQGPLAIDAAGAPGR